MIHIGLNDDEMAALHQTLVQSHLSGVHVVLRDHDEKAVSSLTAPSSSVIGGGVDVDATADVTRQLTLNVVDPKGKLRFSKGSPARGSFYADNFISVEKLIFVPDPVITLDGDEIAGIDEWVHVPVFWGPLLTFVHSGGTAAITAQGKESRGLAPYYAAQGYELHKNITVRTAIKDVMDRIGETRYKIPHFKAKLHRARAVESKAEPWIVVVGNKKVAGFKRKVTLPDSKKDKDKNKEHVRKPSTGLIAQIDPMHIDAFYAGDGYLVVRRFPQHTSYTIREGVNLAEDEEITFDIGDAPNHVKVTGGKRKGKKPAHGEASLPKSHPFSPERMKRNGKKVYRTAFVTAENLTTDKKCHRRALDVLKIQAREDIDIQCSILSNPLLEENDVLRYRTSDIHAEFRLRVYSIPLTDDELMSIGHHKRPKIRHKKHRQGGAVGPPGGRRHGGDPADRRRRRRRNRKQLRDRHHAHADKGN